MNSHLTYRQKLDLQSVANSDNFRGLGATAQNIVHSLLENRSIFTGAIDAQTVALKDIHQNEAVAAALRHEDAKATLVTTFENLSEHQSNEHGKTRQEIVQQAACSAASLRVHMDKRLDEIKDLIKAAMNAKGVKEIRRLGEKTKAAQLSLAAMEVNLEVNMVCLPAHQGDRANIYRKFLPEQVQIMLKTTGSSSPMRPKTTPVRPWNENIPSLARLRKLLLLFKKPRDKPLLFPA